MEKHICFIFPPKNTIVTNAVIISFVELQEKDEEREAQERKVKALEEKRRLSGKQNINNDLLQGVSEYFIPKES